MLVSYEFLQAENSYRQDKLRDQYQTKMSGLSKAAAAVVLASALLAACGTVTAPSAASATDGQANLVADSGPSWEPNEALLEEYLAR